MAVDKQMSILVVDDYSTMLRIIKNLLTQIGFNNIETASNGVEAYSKLQAGKYELIISDWNMDEMTGLELLKKVRASDEFKAIPFIMVTAESEAKNVIAAKEAGVNNYIVKPFSADTLKTKMSVVLGEIT